MTDGDDTGGAGDGVLVVTPTYNERDNLREFIEGVHAVVPGAHVLIVDDASPDGTGALAEQLATDDPRIFVLHRCRKLGLGTAYLCGFRWGLAREYSVFFQMDADWSHDPRHIPSFVDILQRGADLVLGSRYIPGGAVLGWGARRRLLSRGGTTYARLILDLKLTDLTSGYKAFRRSTLERIDLNSVRCQGYGFQIEVTFRALAAGARVEETPIVFEDRRAGKSKMSYAIVLEAVLAVWWLRLASGSPGRR